MVKVGLRMKSYYLVCSQYHALASERPDGMWEYKWRSVHTRSEAQNLFHCWFDGNDIIRRFGPEIFMEERTE